MVIGRFSGVFFSSGGQTIVMENHHLLQKMHLQMVHFSMLCYLTGVPSPVLNLKKKRSNLSLSFPPFETGHPPSAPAVGERCCGNFGSLCRPNGPGGSRRSYLLWDPSL